MNKMDQEPERDKVLKFVEAAAHSPEETSASCLISTVRLPSP